MPYDANFFSSHHPGAASSAAVMVPLMLDLSGARSVVDVGCGIGTWLAEFARLGITNIHGFDGVWVDPKQLLIPRDCFTATDLGRLIPPLQRFDMAISLEVAEHLPEVSADAFVDSLTGLAPAIAFSAAIPMQGGTDHVNEQWPGYWAAKFAARGFVAIDCIRERVWNEPGVEWWYAQNTILYASEESLTRSEQLRDLAQRHGGEPRALVHPGCFAAKATQPIGLRHLIREFPGALASSLRGRRGTGAATP